MTGEVIWSYDTERFPGQRLSRPGGRRRVLPLAGRIPPRPGRRHWESPLWRYSAHGPISAAPVVTDSAIFAATESGEVFAVDTATGAELWTLAAEGMGLQGLTMADGVLYLESDLGILMAVDAANGQLMGEYEKGYFLGRSNYTVHEGVLYFGSFPNGVYAHDAALPR